MSVFAETTKLHSFLLLFVVLFTYLHENKDINSIVIMLN